MEETMEEDQNTRLKKLIAEEIQAAVPLIIRQLRNEETPSEISVEEMVPVGAEEESTKALTLADRFRDPTRIPAIMSDFEETLKSVRKKRKSTLIAKVPGGTGLPSEIVEMIHTITKAAALLEIVTELMKQEEIDRAELISCLTVTADRLFVQAYEGVADAVATKQLNSKDMAKEIRDARRGAIHLSDQDFRMVMARSKANVFLGQKSMPKQEDPRRKFFRGGNRFRTEREPRGPRPTGQEQ